MRLGGQLHRDVTTELLRLGRRGKVLRIRCASADTLRRHKERLYLIGGFLLATVSLKANPMEAENPTVAIQS